MMATNKITSLEVAKLAGVSQSAVSRVFTPGASASKKTGEKVRKAAMELGYRPPSTINAEPVTIAEASEARNTTAPMISSTLPTRPSLIFASIQLLCLGLSKVLCVNGVRINVGQMVLTRILYGPHSIAIALVKPSTACGIYGSINTAYMAHLG